MYLLTCEFYLKMALQRLAKTLDELQKGGEHDVAQGDIITWFGIGDRASKMVGQFAREHNCLLLYPEYSCEAATFFKLA